MSLLGIFGWQNHPTTFVVEDLQIRGVVNNRKPAQAIQARAIGLADSLGCNDCIKSSPVASPVSAGATARGVGDIPQYGSQEAPTLAVSAV